MAKKKAAKKSGKKAKAAAPKRKAKRGSDVAATARKTHARAAKQANGKDHEPPVFDEYLEGIMNRTGEGYVQPVLDSEIDNVDYYDGTTCAEEIEAEGWHVDGYKTVAYMYMYRAGKKPGQSAEKDLRKAEWYLSRLGELEGKKMLDDTKYVELCDGLEILAKQHGVNLKSDVDETVMLVDDDLEKLFYDSVDQDIPF